MDLYAQACITNTKEGVEVKFYLQLIRIERMGKCRLQIKLVFQS